MEGRGGARCRDGQREYGRVLMASAGIHLSPRDGVTSYVQGVRDEPAYVYIVVTVSPDISLYLPTGEAGPLMARTLAAVLLQAASEAEAAMARTGSETEPAP